MDAFTENLLLAEREEMRNERKMVLELRTERGFPLGCDGSARDSATISAIFGSPVPDEVVYRKIAAN